MAFRVLIRQANGRVTKFEVDSPSINTHAEVLRATRDAAPDALVIIAMLL